MRNLRILAALGLLAATGVASAGVTSTWTATNDYDFRGNSQSANDPALQASVDFAADSGWYVGAWASNVDFFAPNAEPKYEVDVYTGFSGSTGEGGLGWDAGIIYYAYPQESDFDYVEIYGSLSYSWFKGKIWYSNAFAGDAAEAIAQGNFGTDDVAAWYVEGNATIPLPANFSVLAARGL